jgi:hypothetical protein
MAQEPNGADRRRTLLLSDGAGLSLSDPDPHDAVAFMVKLSAQGLPEVEAASMWGEVSDPITVHGGVASLFCVLEGSVLVSHLQRRNRDNRAKFPSRRTAESRSCESRIMLPLYCLTAIF